MIAFGARPRVRRQASGGLVVEKRRVVAFFRLLLALAFVTIFYLALLRLGEMPDRLSLLEHLRMRLEATWLNGVLLFLPLVVLPEVIANYRVLARGESLRFDAAARVIRSNRQVVADFADVRELQHAAVNGTCEEMTLRVLLNDGRTLEIDTGGASGRTRALAEDLSALLGTPLVRR